MDDDLAAERQPGDPRGLAQEGTFARIDLDQVHRSDAQDRQDQAGEAGAAADVERCRRRRWDQRQQLRRVEHVAAPEIRQAVGSDQVDLALPVLEQCGIGGQPSHCFT